MKQVHRNSDQTAGGDGKVSGEEKIWRGEKKNPLKPLGELENRIEPRKGRDPAKERERPRKENTKARMQS